MFAGGIVNFKTNFVKTNMKNYDERGVDQPLAGY